MNVLSGVFRSSLADVRRFRKKCLVPVQFWARVLGVTVLRFSNYFPGDLIKIDVQFIGREYIGRSMLEAVQLPRCMSANHGNTRASIYVDGCARW